MRTGKKRINEEALARHLEQIATSLGYRRGRDLVLGRADRAWWFSRRGSDFQTESLSFKLQLHPKPRLWVYLFGSPLAAEELEKKGLADNAAGWSLFEYQLSGLGAQLEQILPQDIELGPEEGWPALFEKLEAEIAAVDPHIWRDLWRYSLQDDPEWLGRA